MLLKMKIDTLIVAIASQIVWWDFNIVSFFNRGWQIILILQTPERALEGPHES